MSIEHERDRADNSRNVAIILLKDLDKVEYRVILCGTCFRVAASQQVANDKRMPFRTQPFSECFYLFFSSTLKKRKKRCDNVEKSLNDDARFGRR